ncbi:MAG: DUF4239 domain-containing protein [Hoeflea sp.]|nr:DUF4239 domain-containing protein [Hoeflea sp.]
MMRKAWQTHDHYAYGAIAVIGTFGAIAVLSWLATTATWIGLVPQMTQVTPPFMNILGVLFGLTLAFLANDTWSAHDRARAAVLREADAIRGLDILTDATPEDQRAVLRQAVRDYASASAAEWPALARCDTSAAAADAADHLLSLFSGPSVNKAAGGTLQQAMLGQVAAIRESRDIRIGLSRTHVNPLKWLGMAFLGFLTLVSVAVIHAGDPGTALIAMGLFGLAAAPTAAIVLIHGNPFQPPSAVSPAHLAGALAGR